MAITAECGACGKRYSVDEKLAGRKVKCKQCGEIFTAGKAAAPAVPPIPAGVDDPPDFDAIAGAAGREASFGTPAPIPQPMPRQAPLPAPPPGAPVMAPVYVAPPSAGSAYGMTAARDRARNRGNRSSVGAGCGTVIGGYAILAGISILLTIIAYFAPVTARPLFYIQIAVCYLLSIVGGIGFLITAFRDSAIQGLLCLLVPFYSLVYLITHWDETKGPFFLQLSAVVLIPGLVITVSVADRRDVVEEQRAERAKWAEQNRSASSYSSSSGSYQSSQTVAPPQSTYTPPTPPPPPADIAAEQAESLRSKIQTFKDNDVEGRSREEVRRKLADLRAETLRNQARFSTKSAWPEINSLLAAIDARIPQLGSEAPDPAIFDDPPLGGTWKFDPAQSAALSADVAYRGYRFRPPAQFVVDINSSEADPAGLAFTHPKENDCFIRVRAFPRTDARQKRPWVAKFDYQIKSTQRGSLLLVEAADQAPIVSYGKIGGMSFTRIEADPTGPASSRWIKYVALDGNDWVEIALNSRKDDSQSIGLLEIAVKTFRKAAANEPKPDAFAADRIVGRLGTDFDKVAPILRKQGTAAEAALLPLAQGQDETLKAAALRILPDVATARSAPVLMKLIQGTDEATAAAARAALKRVAPSQFDDVTEAIGWLKGEDAGKKNQALDVLMASKPDAARRPAIATLLEDILMSERADVDTEKAGKALSIWAGDKTAVRLLPLISKEEGASPNVKGILYALGGTNDKTVASTVIKWVIKEPEAVVAAASRMGTNAEDQVLSLKLLRNERSEVKVAGAQILAAAGTQKCMTELARVAKDPNDAVAAAVAQSAMESIKQRTKK